MVVLVLKFIGAVLFLLFLGQETFIRDLDRRFVLILVTMN